METFLTFLRLILEIVGVAAVVSLIGYLLEYFVFQKLIGIFREKQKKEQKQEDKQNEK